MLFLAMSPQDSENSFFSVGESALGFRSRKQMQIPDKFVKRVPKDTENTLLK